MCGGASRATGRRLFRIARNRALNHLRRRRPAPACELSELIATALAMGADAVALATASLIAIGCQQYRICHTGKCPVGITTQNGELRGRFDIEKSTERYVRYFEATCRELEVLARINGHADVHELCVTDILTLSREVSGHTDVEHA